MLNEYTEMPISDTGLSEGEYRNQEEYRRMLSKSIRTCCSGNYGAKEAVKELIRSYLVHDLELTEKEIENLLPISRPEALTGQQMMELLIYAGDKIKEEYGFFRLWEAAKFGEGLEHVVVTEEMLRKEFAAFELRLEQGELIQVLSQLLFADTVGLGVIDTINQQKGCIEEIQIGMNGYAMKAYSYRELLKEENEKFYDWDGIHVLIRGKMVWLKFLSFGTEEELRRVLRNLIRDARAGELTQNHPMIVVDTADGRRVSISRPPVTDVWVGLIRKFDAISGVTLDSLYPGKEGKSFLAELIRWLVQSGRNIAITGEMASGKTTLFRACLKETKKERNLRVIESESFELNVRSFLPERNTMTMRVAQTTPAEEVLAFARKTTGQIFAIGEINSASVAILAMDLSKIATQLFFSAHYVTTEQMITDFVNAKLCIGGYAKEELAMQDAASSLGFDIHLRNRFGKRYVQYINEVIPKRRETDDEKPYEIREIYRFDEREQQGNLVGIPSEATFLRAEDELGPEEFRAFAQFFEWEGKIS